MQIRLATVAANRHKTRFTVSPSHRRERQLGLRRGPRTMLGTQRATADAARPLAVLRQASRGLVREPARSLGERSFRVRRPTSIAWTRPPDAGPHRVRPRSAAPWRG